MSQRRIDFCKNLLFVMLFVATLISLFGFGFSAPALYEIGGPSTSGASGGYSAQPLAPAAPTLMLPPSPSRR